MVEFLSGKNLTTERWTRRKSSKLSLKSIFSETWTTRTLCATTTGALTSETSKFTSSWNTVRAGICSRLSRSASKHKTSSTKTSYGRFLPRLQVPSSSATEDKNRRRSTGVRLSWHSSKMAVRKFCTATSSPETFSLTGKGTPNWEISVSLELWTKNHCMPKHMLARLITWAQSKSTSRITTRRVTSGHSAASSMKWRPWDHPSKLKTSLHWLWKSKMVDLSAYLHDTQMTSGKSFKPCFSRIRKNALLLTIWWKYQCYSRTYSRMLIHQETWMRGFIEKLRSSRLSKKSSSRDRLISKSERSSRSRRSNFWIKRRMSYLTAKETWFRSATSEYLNLMRKKGFLTKFWSGRTCLQSKVTSGKPCKQ